MATKEVKVVINGEEYVSVAAKKAEDGMQGFFGRIKGWASGFADLAGAWGFVSRAVGTVTDYLGHALDEAQKSAEVMGQLKLAVNNSGASWDQMAPSIENVIGKLARVTKFTDDELAGALQNMILKTGDASWSLKNLGLVADVSAASGKDLESASDALAKAHEGNTTALFKLIPQLKESSDWMVTLRDITKGAAENQDAALGPMGRISRALDEVAESTGRAVLTNEQFKTGGNAVANMLYNLAEWIDTSREKFSGWGTTVLDSVERVGWLGKAVQILRAAINANAGDTDKATVSAEALSFKVADLGKDTKTTTPFVADLSKAMNPLAFGSKQAAEAIGSVGPRANMTAAELRAYTKDANENAERTLAAADATKTHEKALRDQEARLRSDAAEWERMARTILAYEKTVREMQERVSEELQKLGKSVKDNLKSDTVDDNAKAFDRLRVSTDNAFGAFKQGALDIPTTHKTLDAVKGLVKELGSNLEESGRFALDVSEAFGILDQETIDLSRSVLDLGSSMSRLFTKDGFTVSNIGGVIGAVASIASQITAGDTERRRLLSENNRRLYDLDNSIGDLDINASGDDLAGVKAALEKAYAMPHGMGTADFFKNVRDQLLQGGMSFTTFDKVASALGINVKNKDGSYNATLFQGLLDALGKIEPGRVGTSFREQYQFFKESQKLSGDEGADGLQKLANWLGQKASGLSNIVKVDDIEGSRARLLALRERMNSGQGLDASLLGSLNGSEFLDALRDLLASIDDVKSGIASPVKPPDFGIDDPNKKGTDLGVDTASVELPPALADDPTRLADLLAELKSFHVDNSGYHVQHLDVSRGMASDVKTMAVELGGIQAIANFYGNTNTEEGRQFADAQVKAISAELFKMFQSVAQSQGRNVI